MMSWFGSKITQNSKAHLCAMRRQRRQNFHSRFSVAFLAGAAAGFTGAAEADAAAAETDGASEEAEAIDAFSLSSAAS